jgi:hypothetical protein
MQRNQFAKKESNLGGLITAINIEYTWW